MATYIVFTKESTQDQNEFNIYQSKVRKTLEGHPIKLLAAYGPQQALEGPAPEGVVIMEFPTTTAAREWYDRQLATVPLRGPTPFSSHPRALAR